jgi:serine protease Do
MLAETWPAAARKSPAARFHFRLFTILQFAFCILQLAVGSRARAQYAPDSLAIREEAAMQAAAERVAGSVVQIRTIGGLDAVDRTLLPDGPTTGLVLSPDGFIVSSAFNFVQQPASILVTFASGKQAPAELVATDHSRMLVLLKVSGVSDLPVPEFAPVAAIRPGQWSIALGRTFRADRINVSVGIISAVARMFGKVVQTDAAVSTANYGGPLVDIRGRVIGILVPMAPQSTSEVAGVEWYDSGIGFAVPLAAIGAALERMKQGQDQHAGLLGISLSARPAAGGLAAPAELAAVRPDSPAGKAGLKKGDRIVELDGRRIGTQTELRTALGPRYAGESVRLVVQRGDEKIEKTITLIDRLAAFQHAFLGILPMRPAVAQQAARRETAAARDAAAGGGEAEDADTDRPNADGGVIVRMVYPRSPAAEAGVTAGDRLMRINAADVAAVRDAMEALNNVAPGDSVAARFLRNNQTLDLTLTAARMPTVVPRELPPAFAAPAGDDGPPAAGETRDLKLAAFPQSCKLYVPTGHDSGRPLGLLLWIHPPGHSDPDETIRQWRPICDRDGLLLVVPTAADVREWDRTELEYLARLVDRVIRQFSTDPRRVVVYGEGGGGSMAYLLALARREVFTGAAATAGTLPRQVRVADSEPGLRLAFFAGQPSGVATAGQLTPGLQKLFEAGYPVVTTVIVDPSGRMGDDERQDLARWIDTLDRF